MRPLWSPNVRGPFCYCSLYDLHAIDINVATNASTDTYTVKFREKKNTHVVLRIHIYKCINVYHQ